MKKYILDHFVSKGLRQWLRFQKEKFKDVVSPYEPHVVTRSRGGHEYKVYIADGTAEGWYGWGEHGVDYPLQPEIRFLQNHALLPGSVVFDLGAHQCVIASLLAKIVGPKGSVVAVEATPRNVEIGKRNRELNRLDNLHIINAAVSRALGEVEFVPSNNGRVSEQGGELSSVTIDACTVDQLANDYGVPDILFIDVEGFEYQALLGGEQVLDTGPNCFVEVHTGCGLEDYGDSVGDVVDVFAQRDYDLFYAPTSADDTHTFKPLDSGSVPKDRFFLLAIA